MVDYDKASGDGTLRIRDLGSTIEFWVQAGYSNFYWDGLDFSYTANGSTRSVSINYSRGAAWQRVASVVVTDSQTVTFRLVTSTGTSSLAGPTTHSRAIDRGMAPNPPSAVSISQVGATSAYITFSDGDDGGVSIDARQIGVRRTSVSYTELTFSSDRSTTITGLSPGTNYYVYARTHNAKGWSDWGPAKTLSTPRKPFTPYKPLMSSITQISATTKFTPAGDGGAKILEYQIGYGTSATTPQTTVKTNGVLTISGLTPGTKYYFFARARNAVGWSDWSGGTAITTVAGIWVKYNGVWKLGIPYVRYNGVWTIGRPWVKNGGFWKESI